MDYSSAIISALIGVPIGNALQYSFGYTRRRTKLRKFRDVFGEDVGNEFYVVYKSSRLPQKLVLPPVQPEVPQLTRGTTNLSTINSCATTRSIGYLLSECARNVRRTPLLASHSETAHITAMSFVSIGGGNHKTNDLLRDPGNVFVDYAPPAIVAKHSRSVLARNEGRFDYGFIVKIRPKNHPERTWICCFGIGEWAASGAAHYLANHWRKIQQVAGAKPFACITRTEVGKDDSTCATGKLFLNAEDVEKAAGRVTTNRPSERTEDGNRS